MGLDSELYFYILGIKPLVSFSLF